MQKHTVIPPTQSSVNVKTATTTNGLKFWLVESYTVPLVSLEFALRGGAAQDPADKAGVGYMVASLLDEGAAQKKAAISPHLVPDVASVDPLLTLSVPAPVTAATGLDALAHCLEAYANLNAHPAVDLFALEGVRLIAHNLASALQDGANLEARANLSLGSLYGGLCLGPVNTAAVHALAYPLGSEYHVAHGGSIAVLLPHVLRFNPSPATERLADPALARLEQLGGVDRLDVLREDEHAEPGLARPRLQGGA